ncbi:MAG: hypothetical protein Aureis2KO_00870 [Aureisphaera sp.]
MRKLFTLIFCSFFIFSCSDDSVSDEFEEVNGDVPVRLISQVTMNSVQDPTVNRTFQINYVNNRVTSASNGEETGVLVYENDQLITLTGNGEPFSINDLYQSPYEGFQYGDVLQYDSNGNPIRVLLLEETSEGTEEYTAEIGYDNTHNPYYYTLDAARMIDVLDRVDVDFSMAPQPSEIVQARMLFPLNNPKEIVFRNSNNVVVHQVVADYSYDSDDYPVFATFTSTSFVDNETIIYTWDYNYRD